MFGKLTSLHFHAWRRGLKTGMYYLRTRAAADAIKFTVDPNAVKEAKSQTNGGLGRRDANEASEPQQNGEKRKKFQTVSADQYEEETCTNCGS